MEQEKEEQFRFSVVMAVYNVEPFLQEAVESLMRQDIGFEHIQLILVDDGSIDNSGAICDNYMRQFPDNVIAVHKENGGVSSARNKGLEYATGRYINFMDPDDMLEEKSLSAVYNFFLAHEQEIDVVAIPYFFFEGKTGPHALNYKFRRGNRVIDLNKEYTVIQLSAATAYFRKATLKERFDTRLAFAEDAKFLQKVLMKKMALGVVKGKKVRYLYRRRLRGNRSALQTAGEQYDQYLPVIEFCFEELVAYAKEKFGTVPRFVQFMIAYDMQWRMNPKVGLLSVEEEKLLQIKIRKLLQVIEKGVMKKQKRIARCRVYTYEILAGLYAQLKRWQWLKT